ncbi:protein PRY2-like [Branchiostoma floridae]|uniref:Protein PRY2-like n=1 Tax=Branchiostoma floridae TaxID=7739 RepID=A0A9J7L2B0_BRAFL|nr:protein PRY2-like [Branchiostoma floridae]
MRPLVTLLAFYFLVVAVKSAPAEEETGEAVLPDPNRGVETPELPEEVEEILLEARIKEAEGPEDRKKREAQPAEESADTCEDLYRDECSCRYWAASGLCTATNRFTIDFMHTECQKSCGLCPSTEEECTDFLAQQVCERVKTYQETSQEMKTLAEACCNKTIGRCPEPVTDEFAQHCLEAHNEKRARHNAPPLTWDPMCAQEAARYAKKLKAEYDANPRRYPLIHSSRAERTWAVNGKNIVHGESLYWTWSQAPDCTGSSKYKNPIEAWYAEKSDYKRMRGRGQPVSYRGIRLYGHFTQMVWKNSGSVGCGRSDNKPNNILVCYYQKTGNVYQTAAFNRNVEI